MPLPIAAAVGLEIGARFIGNMLGKKAEYEQAAIAYRNNSAANKLIEETNLQNTIRTGYKVGISNIQRGMMRTAMAQQGLGVSVQKESLLGAINANAAASETGGASIDAVASDMRKKADEALINVQENAKTNEFNMDTQLTDIVNQGIDSLQNARLMDYAGPKEASYFQQFLGAALPTAMNYGAQWLGANMSLGADTTWKPGMNPGAGANGWVNLNGLK